MPEPSRVTHGIRSTGRRAGLQLSREVGGLDDEACDTIHQVIQGEDLVPWQLDFSETVARQSGHHNPEIRWWATTEVLDDLTPGIRVR